MEYLWSGFSGVVIGIGLSAACGFRVILPFFGLSIAAMNGLIQPAPEFLWIGTWPALVALATAAILEIGAYYIPWLDNLFDAAVMPLSIAAGTLASAAVITDMTPLVKWSLALIAGGGIAGTVQAGTSLLRGISTIATGGTANVLLATAELAGAAITTVLSLLVPVLALAIVIVMILWLGWKMLRKRRETTSRTR